MFDSSDSGGDDGFSSHHAVGGTELEVSCFAQGWTVTQEMHCDLDLPPPSPQAEAAVCFAVVWEGMPDI